MSDLYKELEAHYHNHCFCEVLSKAAHRIAALEAEVQKLRACADYAYRGHVFYEADDYNSDTFMSLYADAVAAQVRDSAALKGGSNALSIEDPLVEAALKGGA